MSRTRQFLLYGVPLLVLAIGLELIIWKDASPVVKVKAMRYHLYALIEIGIISMVCHIWRRVTHLSSDSSLAVKVIVQVLLIIFIVPASTTYIAMHFWLSDEPNPVALLCSYTLGISVLVFVGLVAMDTSGYVLRLLMTVNMSSKQKNREKRIRTLLALVIGLLLSFFGLVGVNNLAIQQLIIPVKGLHPSLNGTTIAHLSDIHLGPFIGRSRLQKIVDITNSLDADIVVITGDLTDSPVSVMGEGVKPLKNLKTKYGVYFCTGNHDYYTGDIDNWIAYLPNVNVHPLINDRVCIRPGVTPATDHIGSCEHGLYIAGLEDIETRRQIYGPHSMDLHRALSGRNDGVPTLVLAHQPLAAAEAIEWKDVHLVLSGHTHAGQLFPFMIGVYLYNPFFAGLYEPHPDVFVHVSPGVNYFTLPLRHYRPEITLLTLKSF